MSYGSKLHIPPTNCHYLGNQHQDTLFFLFFYLWTKSVEKVLEKSQENRSLAENGKIENESYEEKGKRR